MRHACCAIEGSQNGGKPAAERDAKKKRQEERNCDQCSFEPRNARRVCGSSFAYTLPLADPCINEPKPCNEHAQKHSPPVPLGCLSRACSTSLVARQLQAMLQLVRAAAPLPVPAQQTTGAAELGAGQASRRHTTQAALPNVGADCGSQPTPHAAAFTTGLFCIFFVFFFDGKLTLQQS